MPNRSYNLKLALNSYFIYREKLIRDFVNTFDVDSYNVTFTNFPFCACSEFESETFCKHIFYMLLFYYKVNIKNRIIKNIEWEDPELRNLFQKKYREPTRRAISSPPQLRNRRELHTRSVLYNAQIIATREAEERARQRRIAERDRRIVDQNSEREAAERARRVAAQRVARRVAREVAERSREVERAREVAERARNNVARSVRRNGRREAILDVRNLPQEIIIQAQRQRRLNRSRPSGIFPNILNRPQAPRNSDRPLNSPRHIRIPAPPLEQRFERGISRARLRRLRYSGNVTNMSIIRPPYDCIGRLDKCSICMECVRSNLNIVMKCSICTNEFHNFCLDRWIAQRMREEQMPSCPLCRSIFST